MTKVELVPAAAVARLVLHANVLLDDFSRPTNWTGVTRICERLGFVPIGADGFAPAHILWSRFSNYFQDSGRMLQRQEGFIGQTDTPAIIPMSHYPHFRGRFWRARGDDVWLRRLGEDHEDLLDYVRARIRREGPLTSQAIASSKKLPPEAEGRWARPRVALDYLVATGEVTIVGYPWSTKFDLAERVIPQSHRDAPLTDAEEWACRAAMERLVLATPKEVAGFWGIANQKDAEAWCRDAVERGEIVAAELDSEPGASPGRGYILADWAARASALLPEPPGGLRVLSPHDPSIRKGSRRQRIFGMEPIPGTATDEPRRRGDWTAFPVLQGERFVARVIGRFEKSRRCLNVAHIHWAPDSPRDEHMVGEIVACLERLARLLEVTLEGVSGVYAS